VYFADQFSKSILVADGRRRLYTPLFAASTGRWQEPMLEDVERIEV